LPQGAAKEFFTTADVPGDWATDKGYVYGWSSNDTVGLNSRDVIGWTIMFAVGRQLNKSLRLSGGFSLFTSEPQEVFPRVPLTVDHN
jgi:hypothetical protein